MSQPKPVLAQLAEVLTNPGVVTGLRSDEILALQSAVSTIQTALSAAFVSALQREMTAKANPKQSLDALMDAEMVSRLLDVTKPAVYALMRSGELKCVRIGKFRKVTTKTFMDYLWKLKQAGNADAPARVGSFVEHGKRLMAKGGK
jgi:hypothetical protein